jgi:hypothetical protein
MLAVWAPWVVFGSIGVFIMGGWLRVFFVHLKILWRCEKIA